MDGKPGQCVIAASTIYSSIAIVPTRADIALAPHLVGEGNIEFYMDSRTRPLMVFVQFGMDVTEYKTGEIPTRRRNMTAPSHLEYACIDHLDTLSGITRLTAIMASVGISEESDTIVDMVSAGLNIARVSLASASRTNHRHSFKMVREAERICGERAGCFWPLALAVELKGHTICTGLLDSSLNEVSITLEMGDTILVTSDQEYYNKCRSDLLYVDCPHLSSHLKPGMTIIIDRGEIVLSCLKETPPYVLCRVERRGILGSLREVCIPDVKLNLCNVTTKDAADVAFAIENEVDILIIPHVRKAETPKIVKRKIRDVEKHTLVVSKICNWEGILNIDSIIEASDGIILSQDNLSLELPSPNLWMAINYTIAKCIQEGIPAFVATSKQARSAAPRALSAAAETSRAVLAGAAGLSLEGGELGGGGPEPAAVASAGETCRRAETVGGIERDLLALCDSRPLHEMQSSAACYGAALTARACGAACILVVSTSSRPARCLARLRPACPLLTVVGKQNVARRLHLYRAVVPLLYQEPAKEEFRSEMAARARFGMAWGVARGWLRAGQPFVLVSDYSLRSTPGDLVRVLYVPRNDSGVPVEGQCIK